MLNRWPFRLHRARNRPFNEHLVMWPQWRCQSPPRNPGSAAGPPGCLVELLAMARRVVPKLLKTLDVGFSVAVVVLASGLLLQAAGAWHREAAEDRALDDLIDRTPAIASVDAGTYRAEDFELIEDKAPSGDDWMPKSARPVKDDDWKPKGSTPIPAAKRKTKIAKSAKKGSWEDLPDVNPPKRAARWEDEPDVAPESGKIVSVRPQDVEFEKPAASPNTPFDPDEFLRKYGKHPEPKQPIRPPASHSHKESETDAGLAAAILVAGLGGRHWMKWLMRDEPAA